MKYSQGGDSLSFKESILEGKKKSLTCSVARLHSASWLDVAGSEKNVFAVIGPYGFLLAVQRRGGGRLKKKKERKKERNSWCYGHRNQPQKHCVLLAWKKKAAGENPGRET